MSRYLKSYWVRAGLFILLVGSGPLFFIIAAAGWGCGPDPNPNPIGPGILCGITFWPAIISLLVGVVRVRRRGAV